MKHIIFDNTEDGYFDDEVCNLNIPTDGRIIAIASLGLWDGRKSGYKIGKRNVNEIMFIGNEDFVEIWSDGFNVHKKSSHHDGTNFILFREVREERNIDKFTDMIYNNETISRSTLNYYTKSLAKKVKEVYGW